MRTQLEKNKNKSQRRLQRSKPPFQPAAINVIAPGDANKKRWKVAVYSIACEINTIFADNPQEAVDKLQKGFGSHSGVEGPTMIGVACAEFGSPRAKDFIAQFMTNLNQMRQAAEGEEKKVVLPMIQVVKS